MIRSRVRHTSSGVRQAIHVATLPYLRGKGFKTDRKSHLLLGIGELEFNRTSVEGFMSKIHQSMAALVLALVGLVGCDYEPRAVGDANPPVWRR